jgi:hypothetical protein
MKWNLYSHMYKYLATFKDIPVPPTNEWVVFQDELYKVTSVFFYQTEVRVVAVKMDFPPPAKMKLRKRSVAGLKGAKPVRR